MAKPKRALPELFTLAAVAANSNDLVQAERLYREILAVRPGQPDAMHSLSVVRYQRGRHDEAITLLERLLARRPDLAEAHYSRGTMLQNLGRFGPALASFDKALELVPDYRYALQNRAATLAALGRFEAALADYDRLIALDARAVDAHLGRAYVLLELGRLAEAVAGHDRVLALQPDHAVAHNVRGNALRELGKFAEALASFDRAIALRPDYAEAHLNRGNALRNLGRFEEALAAYDRPSAIAAADLPGVLNNRGLVLQELGRFDEALSCLDRAIALAPRNPDFHFSRAQLLLLLGNYAVGWPEYEWRRKQKNRGAPRYQGPEWRGEPLAGKRIFLYAEQGFGDAIQFARYASVLGALGAKVSIGAPRGLDRLLRGLAGDPVIVPHGERVPEHEVHLPLLSVPFVLGAAGESIPGDSPYISADPARAAYWNEQLRGDGALLRVGFRWAGSSTFVDEHHRSTDFPRWRPLLETAGVRWYSLQTEARAAEVSLLAGTGIEDLSGLLTDFAETAAIIANLDLVITTDTAVAHLAGAMGKPVWIALKWVPDWRWLLDRDDSPWYRTARLFRQRRLGDWDDPIARIAAELAKLVAGR